MEGCEPMSFLKPLMGGGAGEAAGAATAAPAANPMASGLGRLFGTDGGHVSDIAARIGTGANQIAAAGGAQPGYAAPEPQVNNHLQTLDPEVLRALIQHFRPTTGVQYQ